MLKWDDEFARECAANCGVDFHSFVRDPGAFLEELGESLPPAEELVAAAASDGEEGEASARQQLIACTAANVHKEAARMIDEKEAELARAHALLNHYRRSRKHWLKEAVEERAQREEQEEQEEGE